MKVIKTIQIDDPWCIYIPKLHRALNDAACIDELPRLEALTEHGDICAYWECVYYCLNTLLGWKEQGKGLANWYRAGKPVNHSPVLALLKHHWDRDGLLDYYAAWLWGKGPFISHPDQLQPSHIALNSADVAEDWWHAFKRRGLVMRHDPFYGGSNPLHLGHSEHLGVSEDSLSKSIEVYRLQDDDMRVVLVVNSINSWKTELLRCIAKLPLVRGKSWRVKVFDVQVGFLGEFRQSRVTRIWFTGKHGVHVVGN